MFLLCLLFYSSPSWLDLVTFILDLSLWLFVIFVVAVVVLAAAAAAAAKQGNNVYKYCSQLLFNFNALCSSCLDIRLTMSYRKTASLFM